jgi:hypothetical protein
MAGDGRLEGRAGRPRVPAPLGTVTRLFTTTFSATSSSMRSPFVVFSVVMSSCSFTRISVPHLRGEKVESRHGGPRRRDHRRPRPRTELSCPAGVLSLLLRTVHGNLAKCIGWDRTETSHEHCSEATGTSFAPPYRRVKRSQHVKLLKNHSRNKYEPRTARHRSR